MWRAKAITIEAARSLSEVTREALLVYAMTGSAVASIAIIVVPHLEVMLRCVLSGRG
jgi:hypothetical protein